MPALTSQTRVFFVVHFEQRVRRNHRRECHWRLSSSEVGTKRSRKNSLTVLIRLISTFDLQRLRRIRSPYPFLMFSLLETPMEATAAKYIERPRVLIANLKPTRIAIRNEKSEQRTGRSVHRAHVRPPLKSYMRIVFSRSVAMSSSVSVLYCSAREIFYPLMTEMRNSFYVSKAILISL